MRRIDLKNAEAVGKPRECQHCDEASQSHEAEGLSLGLGKRAAASRAFEFWGNVSFPCNRFMTWSY